MNDLYARLLAVRHTSLGDVEVGKIAIDFLDDIDKCDYSFELDKSLLIRVKKVLWSNNFTCDLTILLITNYKLVSYVSIGYDGVYEKDNIQDNSRYDVIAKSYECNDNDITKLMDIIHEYDSYCEDACCKYMETMTTYNDDLTFNSYIPRTTKSSRSD